MVFSGTSWKGYKGQNLKALQEGIWLEVIQSKARKTTAAKHNERVAMGERVPNLPINHLNNKINSNKNISFNWH
jgi:hypothetical protein